MSESSRARAERGAFTAAARRIGANKAAGLEGLELAVSSLDNLMDAIDGDQMRDLIEYHTDQMLQDARSNAARIGSGRYRNAIRKKVFTNDDGYAGTVFALQLPWNRKGKGSTLWPKNVPLWLEYGTRKARAFPHLLPALAAGRERFNRSIERLLQAAVR
jgi:hypothetical protein